MGQFDSTVTIATEYALLGNNSDYGLLTVGVSATELTKNVENATSLFMQADGNNADLIYLGLDNTVSSSNYFATLSAGEKIQIITSTSSPVLVYGIGTNTADKVAILEGVN